MIKKTLSVLLCGAMIFTAVGCSSKDAQDNNSSSTIENSESNNETSVSVKDIVANIVEKGYIIMPIEIDDTMAKDRYDLNLDDVEEYAIAETGRSPGVGFVAMAKAKEGKLESVKANFEKIKLDMVGKAFYPDEIEKAEKLSVETIGDVVFMGMFYEDYSEDAFNIIRESLGK